MDNEEVEKIMVEIETFLEKKEDKKACYDEMGDFFKDRDKFDYFSAISKLRRAKRLDRTTENGKIMYKLI